MTLEKIMLIIILGFVAWLFWRQLALRELALSHAKRLCDQQDVQLLDQSVGLARMRFRRLKNRGWGLLREYRFEFTSTGERRYTGKIFMVGQTLQNTELEAFREGPRFE